MADQKHPEVTHHAETSLVLSDKGYGSVTDTLKKQIVEQTHKNSAYTSSQWACFLSGLLLAAILGGMLGVPLLMSPEHSFGGIRTMSSQHSFGNLTMSPKHSFEGSTTFLCSGFEWQACAFSASFVLSSVALILILICGCMLSQTTVYSQDQRVSIDLIVFGIFLSASFTANMSSFLVQVSLYSFWELSIEDWSYCLAALEAVLNGALIGYFFVHKKFTIQSKWACSYLNFFAGFMIVLNLAWFLVDAAEAFEIPLDAAIRSFVLAGMTTFRLRSACYFIQLFLLLRQTTETKIDEFEVQICSPHQKDHQDKTQTDKPGPKKQTVEKCQDLLATWIGGVLGFILALTSALLYTGKFYYPWSILNFVLALLHCALFLCLARNATVDDQLVFENVIGNILLGFFGILTAVANVVNMLEPKESCVHYLAASALALSQSLFFVFIGAFSEKSIGKNALVLLRFTLSISVSQCIIAIFNNIFHEWDPTEISFIWKRLLITAYVDFRVHVFLYTLKLGSNVWSLPSDASVINCHIH